MKRNVEALGEGPFDVLVVGGGIYGAWTALEAALRGMRVALVERNDWASGTSSASTKLVHGGLRYLERMHFGLVRKSLRERRRLFALAPHRVRPLRFVLPVYRGGRASPWRLRAGLTLYDLLAGAGQPVARHESLGTRELAARYPFLSSDGVRAAFTYGDCWMDDARFVLEIVEAAAMAGAVCANYAEVVQLRRAGGRAAGATVRDVATEASIAVHARAVVDTSGPWAGSLVKPSASPLRVRLLKGAHITMPPLPTNDAHLLIARRDGRVFFLVPWYGKTLVGTTDTNYEGDPGAVTVDAGDVDYLLTEAGRFVPALQWDASKIGGAFAGLRALRDEPGTSPSSLSREWVVEEPEPGLVVSIGGKFTSARADATALVDRAVAHIQGARKGDATARAPLPFAPRGRFDAWYQKVARDAVAMGVDEEAAHYLPLIHGSDVERVLALMREDAKLAARAVPALPFVAASILHAAATEMVVTLDDVVRRRLPLAILHRLERDDIERIARLVAPVLGWSQEDVGREVETVHNRYSGAPHAATRQD